MERFKLKEFHLRSYNMGQGIQEWLKENLWKTAFITLDFLEAFFHKFYLVYS